MALKTHFALLVFIVCTFYTSLRPSWISVATSQTSVCNSLKSTLLWYLSARTSERSMHTSHLTLYPSKIKDQSALLKYWGPLLKTWTTHVFSIALRTTEISTALFWSTTQRTHFQKKTIGINIYGLIEKSNLVVSVSRNAQDSGSPQYYSRSAPLYSRIAQYYTRSAQFVQKISNIMQEMRSII